jgi:hypothetical protein
MGIKKAQLMSLILLVLFVLMLSILLTFAELIINYNSVAQSVSLTSSTTNYALLLRPGINSFASASLSRALTVLASFELQPSLRKGNFINNLNSSLSMLVSTGTIPGVSPSSAAGQYLSNAMGNLTLSEYNSMLLGSINSTYRIVSITQSPPNVTQYSSYNLSITFIENVSISTSEGNYHYALPVNVSVPLSGTQDLYYAQRGINQYINFSQGRVLGAVSGQGRLTPSTINYATGGNTIGIAYGTIYVLPSGVTCAGYSNPISNYLPSQLSTPPLNSTIIIATPDAALITNSVCDIANDYAGLITYTVTKPPTVPWLEFSGNTVSSLQTGQQALIYGPELALLNETGLQSSFYNGYYYSSPFAPSYIDRTNGVLTSSSPYGMFNLLGSNQQVAYLKGLTTSIVSIPHSPSLSITGNTLTVAGWVNPGSSSGTNIFVSSWTGTSGNAIFDIGTSNGKPYADVVNAAGNTFAITGSNALSTNRWQFFTFVLNNTHMAYYLNGSLVAQSYAFSGNLPQFVSGTCQYAIGAKECGTSSAFSGQISNVQIYGSALPVNTINYIYSEGIGGVPASSSSLDAWYPLNGNANDYSGNGNNGTQYNVAYQLPDNYSSDAIFASPVTSSTALPVPGLLSCSNNSQCGSDTMPHIFLGSSPLGIGGSILPAHFNGKTSNITTANPIVTSNTAETVSAWIHLAATPSGIATVVTSEPKGAAQGDAININQGGTDNLYYWVNTGTWNGVSYAGPLSFNSWYQVAGTFNGLAAVLYLDGVAVNSISLTGNMVMPTGPGYIGSYGFSQYFPGSISDVQYYNAALSPNQMMSLYKEGISGVPVMPSNIVGWWPLNGNGNDYSGYANNGNVINVSYTPAGLDSKSLYIPQQTGASAQSEAQFFGFSPSSLSAIYTASSGPSSGATTVSLTFTNGNSITQGTSDNAIGTTSALGDTVELLDCVGSSSCTPSNIIATNANTVIFNMNALPANTYVLQAYDVNAIAYSATNVVVISPAVQCTNTIYTNYTLANIPHTATISYTLYGGGGGGGGGYIPGVGSNGAEITGNYVFFAGNTIAIYVGGGGGGGGGGDNSCGGAGGSGWYGGGGGSGDANGEAGGYGGGGGSTAILNQGTAIPNGYASGGEGGWCATYGQYGGGGGSNTGGTGGDGGTSGGLGLGGNGYGGSNPSYGGSGLSGGVGSSCSNGGGGGGGGYGGGGGGGGQSSNGGDGGSSGASGATGSNGGGLGGTGGSTGAGGASGNGACGTTAGTPGGGGAGGSAILQWTSTWGSCSISSI